MKQSSSFKGGQVIATVYNPILIWEFKEVFSVEHRAWMKSKTFVETQT